MILRQDKIGFDAGSITPATKHATWVTDGASTNVAGLLGWAKYGNGHTIFDASRGFAPSGAAVDAANAQAAWGATYPTLMGWNGTNTYGVRVDSARVADIASNASAADNVLGKNQVWQDVTAGRATGTTYTNVTGRTIYVLVLFDRAADSSGATIAMTVSGIALDAMHIAESNGTLWNQNGKFCSLPIPAGGTYSFAASSTNAIIKKWLELR